MRDREYGGIVSFVIIGIVLTGLFAGGLYLSKHQARQARESYTSTPTVVQPEQGANRDEQRADRGTGAGNEQRPTSQPGAQNQQNRQNQPANPAPQTPQNRVAQTGPSDTLPETGPADTFVHVAAFGTIAFAATRVLQSRRVLSRATLRR